MRRLRSSPRKSHHTRKTALYMLTVTKVTIIAEVDFRKVIGEFVVPNVKVMHPGDSVGFTNQGWMKLHRR